MRRTALKKATEGFFQQPARSAALLPAFILPAVLPACPAAEDIAVERLAYEVVHTYPHSKRAFTQGLVYQDGKLYESAGLYGHSSLTVTRLETGERLKKHDLDKRYFAEGLAIAGDRLVQLSYRERTGFVYDKAALTLKSVFQYEGEGWGLAFDGRAWIMSDGTPKLRFLNADTFREEDHIEVTRAGEPVDNLNELEYVDGMIYANVWLKSVIVRIDPDSGRVTGVLDLFELAEKHTTRPQWNVLNGIAYIPERKTFLVTGKLWPKLYEIRLKSKPQRTQSSQRLQ